MKTITAGQRILLLLGYGLLVVGAFVAAANLFSSNLAPILKIPMVLGSALPILLCVLLENALFGRAACNLHS